MMELVKIFVGLVSLCFLLELTECQDRNKKPYKVVCYLGSWANYRYGNGKFVIEDIDPFLCTHLVYGFAKLGDDNRIAAYDPYLDLKENWGLGAYQRFINLTNINPDLKALLAIGGWNEGSTKYSKMAANPKTRKIFVDSCIEFLERYGFHGLDMDWEYPANRGGAPEDKQNFIALLKELKQAFVEHELLLSAAVSAGKNTIDTAYDIPAISRHLDFINLMTYDFAGAWDTVTGLNAPLYGRSEETEKDRTFNVDFAVNYWLRRGAPAKKLVLGMATYGRSFTLQRSRPHGIGAPVSGKGTAGPYTREPGMLGYNEICAMLDNDHGWKVVFDPYQQAPYAFKDRQWVGFDSIESITLKVEYIKTRKLGGGMIWSLETDDFKNHCGDGRYPLLSTIARELNGITPVAATPTYTSASPYRYTGSSGSDESASFSRASRGELSTEITVTPRNDLSTPSDDLNLCTKEGYIRDENNCQKFFFCKEKESSGFYRYSFECGPDTVYNAAISGCDYVKNVPECNKLPDNK